MAISGFQTENWTQTQPGEQLFHENEPRALLEAHNAYIIHLLSVTSPKVSLLSPDEHVQGHHRGMETSQRMGWVGDY